MWDGGSNIVTSMFLVESLFLMSFKTQPPTLKACSIVKVEAETAKISFTEYGNSLPSFDH